MIACTATFSDVPFSCAPPSSSAKTRFASSFSAVQRSTFSFRLTSSSMLGLTSNDTTDATVRVCR